MTPELCHLWRCAAFGAAGHGTPRSYEEGVQGLLGWPDDTTPAPLTTAIPPGLILTLLQISDVIRWWLNEMISTPWPLREKMVLFWHSHFATSADPVFSAGLLLRQNQTLRALAVGRFEDILTAMASDPAMLVYLDGQENHRAHPNENFAREVMELFTVGLGNYQEQDVKAAARAFTGWRLGGFDRHAIFHPETHDDGEKVFLGQRGPLTGADVIHTLAHHPATAHRITNRLYRFLTGLDASAAESERLSNVFLATRGNIGAVLRALLLGAEFRQCRGGICSPIEWLVQAARGLGHQLEGFGFIEPLRRMGQLPFLPPSVKGWEDGAAWINTATLLERLNFAMQWSTPAPAPLLETIQGCPPARVARVLLDRLGFPDAAPAWQAALNNLYQHSPEPSRLIAVALASPDAQLK